MSLLPREIEVLTTIVEEYIASAAPVGSRTVAKRSRLKLSPASMRNTMSDLTDKGYLEQPHTSAGRSPTTKAFRFYLDTALRFGPLAEAEREMIKSWLGRPGAEMTDVLRQASRALSSLSRQVCLALAPSRKLARCQRIEFVLMRPGLVMSILIMQGGMVQNRIVEAPREVTSEDLIRFGNYLNALFADRTLPEARAAILRELRGAREALDELRRRALALAEQSLADDKERDVIVDGASHMLDQPEFADLGHMRELLRFLEERANLLELLDKTMEADGTVITIGEESSHADLRECSLVSAAYGVEGEPLGVISVIGPLRMDYAKVVPLVDFTAHILGEILKKRL